MEEEKTPTRNFDRVRVILAAMVAILAGLPVALVLSFGLLIELLDAVAVSVGMAIILAYGGGLLSLDRRHWTSGHLLALGICLTWVAVVLRFGWAWLWRIFDQPHWMHDHWFVAFIMWLFVVGGTFYLLAQGAINNYIPPRSWVRLSAILAAGLFIGMVMARLFGTGELELP